jgi:hypothetical protein
VSVFIDIPSSEMVQNQQMRASRSGWWYLTGRIPRAKPDIRRSCTTIRVLLNAANPLHTF